MTDEKTTKFDKKLKRMVKHLILTSTKDKNYKQTLDAIGIGIKLDKRTQEKVQTHKPMHVHKPVQKNAPEEISPKIGAETIQRWGDALKRRLTKG